VIKITVYTYESSRTIEISDSVYIIIKAVNNETDERDELTIEYYDYCFVSNKDAEKIRQKYNNEIIPGYTFYQDKKECCKVKFKSSSEMLRILTEFDIKKSNSVKLRPNRKFLIEKNITYKFIINTKDKPINHNKVFAIDVEEVDNPRTIYADIEVDNEGDIRFPTGDNAIHPIICIAYTRWNGDKIWTCLDRNLKSKRKETLWKTKHDHPKLNNMDVRVIFFKEEIDLISYVGEIQKEYDSYVVTGWNFIRFDMYYLIGRCKVLGINKEILSINNYIGHKKRYDKDGRDIVMVWSTESYFIDSMEAFIDFYPEKLRYNDLDTVSKEVLGETFGKLKMDTSISEAYRSNKKELMTYNIIDSYLIKLVDEKINLMKFYELRRKRRGITIYDSFKTIKTIEASLLYFAEKSKIALPDPSYKDRIEEGLKGAYVFTDILQIVPYAFMFDFKAEYPSIAASLNCSSTTIVRDEKLYEKLKKAYIKYKDSKYKNKDNILNYYTVSPGKGKLIFFENKEDCFEKKFIMDRMVLRDEYFVIKNQFDFESDEYKFGDACEKDVKLDGNALYGAWKNKYFLLNDEDCAQAITGIGRSISEHQIEILRKMSHKVILSDTDSADVAYMNEKATIEEAVKVGYEIEKELADKMNDFVRKEFLFGSKNGYLQGFDPEKNNSDTQWIFAKFEKLFGPMIVTGKMKHYAYKLLWRDGRKLSKPKYKVVGFECIQRSVSLLLKEAQSKLIKKILDKKITKKEHAIDHIRKYKTKMRKENYDYLATTAGFKNEITNYKAVQKGHLPPLHAQAMCFSMENFGLYFEPLSRFKVLRVKRKKSGKYENKSTKINGITVYFEDKAIGYYEIDDIPNDFFEYFKPDYEHMYKNVVINKCEDFLTLMNVDKIIFSGQKQLSEY